MAEIKEHMEVIGADGVHIGTVDRVRAMIPQLQATIPPSIHLHSTCVR